MRGTGDWGWGTRRAIARGGSLAVLCFLLSACGSDGASTAGAFDEGGASTAGPFVDESALPASASEAADLLAEIDREFSPDQTLGYGRARDVLYAYEQDTYGALCGVYSNFCVTLGPGDESTQAMALDINAEHVWPQSRGARAEPLKSDLHHLFPSRVSVNSSRGNLPFGEVRDDRADAWYRDADSQSRPPTSGSGAWAERGEGRFEPPESKKGDIARAVFYVAAVYPERVEADFLATMRADLLAWNRADPPDAAARALSAWIATLQGTENPFVRDPGLADRIWGGGPVTSATSPVPPAAPPVPTSSPGYLRISAFHYDNAGEDTGEGIEVSGPPGASQDGWRLVLVNGSGGRVYDTVSLSGTLPASGTRWTDTPGLQNGGPDGIALVGPDGRVAEFLSYEGAFVAEDGPAQGMRSVDIGASEASDTPVGRVLRRGGSGWALASR